MARIPKDNYPYYSERDYRGTFTEYPNQDNEVSPNRKNLYTDDDTVAYRTRTKRSSARNDEEFDRPKTDYRDYEQLEDYGISRNRPVEYSYPERFYSDEDFVHGPEENIDTDTYNRGDTGRQSRPSRRNARDRRPTTNSSEHRRQDRHARVNQHLAMRNNQTETKDTSSRSDARGGRNQNKTARAKRSSKSKTRSARTRARS